MSTDTLVSAKEAARAVGMGPSSLYRLAKAGKIPSYAAGPRLTGIRFSIPELREALRRRPVPSEKAAT
jgi:predicted DNA-binding transcriptional regulator AlpA